jgi:hypothetical protein
LEYNKEIIELEILKNGNTNMITNSGLLSGSQIFAIGDSHTIFFHNSIYIKEHWAFNTKILPLTIYKFINTEFDLYHMGDILGGGHENYNIKSGDYVLFYYGYNDIQKNVNLHCNNDYIKFLDEILTKYIDKIKKIEEIFKIKPIVPCIYPIPRIDAVNVNTIGSDYDRKKYTEYANSKISLLCDENKIVYLNIFDLLVDENGYISEKITKDSIHIDYDNESIRKIIEDKILSICI